MKKISIVVDKYYQKNRLFDLSDPKVNRDDCMYPFYALKRRCAEMGYDLSTNDINTPSESCLVLYNDIPAALPDPADARKSVLLAWESPLVKPQNFDRDSHARFERVYTYDDRLVDGKKYRKLFYTQRFPDSLDFHLRPAPEKFMCVIAGNKSSMHPLELYSERLRTIKWYEENHPEELDLYGFGWNERVFRGPKIVRALNRIGAARKACVRDKRSSYRGKADDKRSVFGRYRFALCYENIRDIPGYITEKLLDAMLSGCVPIYWGAPNVSDFVPSDCFIDRRKFSSEEEMYRFLVKINNNSHENYRDRIRNFLNSDASRVFRTENFVDEMARMVLEMLGKDERGKYLLTIAIPTFNRAKYLEELLGSIVPQIDRANRKVERVQLLISDNCSLDGTPKIVNAFSNGRPWLVYHRNEVNVGGDANFLLCIERSFGKYVWLFGDDDLISDNGVSRVLRVLERQSPALLICSSKSSRSMSFNTYKEALRYYIPRDMTFAWSHSLITANVFRKDEFDLDLAARMKHTNYGHMYGMVPMHTRARDGVCVFSRRGSAITVRRERAPFEKAPLKIEKKLIAYLYYLSDAIGYAAPAACAHFFFRYYNRFRGMVLPLGRIIKRSARNLLRRLK